ncbi:YifB family Mg chelatase-like AAA ATPase [Aneurinibacillus sp. Ricciae_BoGa-3]|uniref:YifB family Mg chelatase-like AAA ATPase n=1 Tax=Aneurinibacillus sp. Ricciae_BoGa-3 TaxID=3022697 RepID=UPI002341C04A|nr:YifB family Mg chelatase-like AAA ATPase [Aneurinibacillus sp. Ricciae_BoGa-3]WCK52914.1 YifB family Mg chelatase-like AAA ATPase [Aneurinibacillus sp. Ricciae_BoGa-3]
MFVRVLSATVFGIEGIIVEVEVDISNGLPSFEVSGLAASSVKEARDRVKAAIKNSGFNFPLQRITINLAPADLRKTGSMLDAAIAVGILAASGQINIHPEFADWIVLGELSLEGNLRPIHGILPMVLAAKKHHLSGVILPRRSPENAERIPIPMVRSHSLTDCIQYLSGGKDIPASNRCVIGQPPIQSVECYSDVKGHTQAKRALQVAAAGFHHLLMVGPPGTGKTMLASRFHTIMPPLGEEESLEVDTIYSACGLLKQRIGREKLPPFRSPHSSSTAAGLAGGGAYPLPGEMSLAHNGILFLDEIAEFSRNVLELLRQPLESKYITLVRKGAKIVYPCHFLLLSSLNPCPCGSLGFESPTYTCTCTPSEIKRYRKKLSGPLIDRIDVQIEVPRINLHELNAQSSLTSAEMQKQVIKAREIQRNRYEGTPFRFNSDLYGRFIGHYIPLTSSTKMWLSNLYETLGLSSRSYDKILKMARTIADLSADEQVTEFHISEALQYRSLDQSYWEK